MNLFCRTIATTFFLVLSTVLLSQAAEQEDTAFMSLYNNYIRSYNEPDGQEQFYQLSQRMKDYYLAKEDFNQYYLILLNESLYDSENGDPYQAISKANAMLMEMRNKGHDHFEKVYIALGTVYEGRGNMRMAEYYFKKAVNESQSKDDITLLGIYSQLANLKMLTSPKEAQSWNERCEKASRTFPEYRQIYFFITAATSFAQHNKDAFLKAYNSYLDFHNAHADEVDSYGMTTLMLMAKAFDGDYSEAIAMIAEAVKKKELNEVSAYDLHILILRIAGKPEQALAMSAEQRQLIDSLNTGLIFNNLNELNTQAMLAQTKHRTAKKMGRMAIVIIVLSLITIIVLVVLMLMHRRLRRHLIDKNRQLKMALAMAEESDRMKTEFVHHVSHEIRTPLNAIIGFNEILNGSDMHLTDGERDDLLSRIKTNTKAITDIVEEMLHLSEQESGDYYVRRDKMLCNKMLSELLYKNLSSVSALIELSYTTEVINSFTILTNESSVRQIVVHLIQNAIKFTSKGSINLHCRTIDEGKTLEISVTDTGRGIKPEMRDKVFDLFVKEDSFQQGMGLGLTVSRKIAQKLGGNLMLDSSYSGGSRFVLTLPATE